MLAYRPFRTAVSEFVLAPPPSRRPQFKAAQEDWGVRCRVSQGTDHLCEQGDLADQVSLHMHYVYLSNLNLCSASFAAYSGL